MSEYKGNDDPRDAHLLAALRHAPDRDALPPREVSQRILAAAHAAVRPTRAAAAPWWQTLSAWLMRPQVAASFGTLAVASLVGVMWSTREPPPVEPALQRSAAEQSAATSAVVSAATPPATAAAPPETRSDERDLLKQAAPVTPPPKQEAAARRAKEVKPAQDKADARPASDTPRERVADNLAAGRVAAAPVAAPAAPAAPAARLEEARGADSADAAVSAGTAVAAKASRAQAPAASMPALESLSRQRLATGGDSAAVDPLWPVDALLAGGSATWTTAGRTLPHGAAQAAWWLQLRRATRGLWQPLPAARADLAPSLALLAAGKSIASIDFAGDGVHWCPADRGTCWRAPLTAAQREAWLAEIARW